MAAEKLLINHFCHEHPLILTQNFVSNEPLDCFACEKPIVSECVYACIEHKYCNNKSRSVIHKKCAELPTQILHPSHPHHPLHLFEDQVTGYRCNLCRHRFRSVLRYRCHRCDFDIDITCKKLSIDELFGERSLTHPGHHHPLTLMRKLSSLIACDACGTEDRDMVYSYFCHLKCATSTAQIAKREFLSKDETTDLIELPLHDISKELITPFVMREEGLHSIPNVNDMPETVKMPETTAIFSCLFNYHKHPLSLVLEDHNKAATNDDDDDEEEEELKICDLCIAPISSPPYYECVACKYFVHSICYFLPKTLSSSSSSSRNFCGDCPNTHDKIHKFTLYTTSKERDENIELWYSCGLCKLETNGIGYQCEECEMKIDVRCASLPPTIRHASHPRHKGLIMARILPEDEGGMKRKCHCCHEYPFSTGSIVYRCSNDDCDFVLHLSCALLPQSLTKPDSDKHPLVLTFDASPDHPSDFFCDVCEKEMHPKRWMYHCRQCDNSLHISCIHHQLFMYYSSVYFKFGRRLQLDDIHPHSLTFKLSILKKRCNICSEDVYAIFRSRFGFECASCNYLVCFFCGFKEIRNKM
ncbi:hypothetical protein C2S51_016442 [Perilla frutescens var. frutescens]|nr:hypothetical protein C2S51_016442 [Perilla frutescens var. frutescens]